MTFVPRTIVESVVDLLANHLEIVAPVVALVAAWTLYGVLGKRMLGADDDFWPALRNLVLPVLHRLGMTSGLYARDRVDEDEFVGIVSTDEEALERELQAAGFYRNPLAALKRSPQGWRSDGSWARRYGRLRGLGDVLRRVRVPVAGALGRMVGRFLQAAGDVLAFRQVHVTVFATVRDGEERVWVYAHGEPNSLNPLTAWRHYLGRSWSASEGVERVRSVLARRDVPFRTAVP